MGSDESDDEGVCVEGVSPEGLEPSTLGLKGRCSTTELWALRRAAIWMICGENARWRGSGPTIVGGFRREIVRGFDFLNVSV